MSASPISSTHPYGRVALVVPKAGWDVAQLAGSIGNSQHNRSWAS